MTSEEKKTYEAKQRRHVGYQTTSPALLKNQGFIYQV